MYVNVRRDGRWFTRFDAGFRSSLTLNASSQSEPVKPLVIQPVESTLKDSVRRERASTLTNNAIRLVATNARQMRTFKNAISGYLSGECFVDRGPFGKLNVPFFRASFASSLPFIKRLLDDIISEEKLSEY